MRAAPLLLLLALAAPANAQDQGHRDYILRCAGCHGMEGKGTEVGGVPAFPDSIGAIAGFDAGRTYILHVPGVQSASLDEAAIAEVMNYVLRNWSDGTAEPFTEAEVQARQDRRVPDIVAARRDIVLELRAQGIEIASYPWP